MKNCIKIVFLLLILLPANTLKCPTSAIDRIVGAHEEEITIEMVQIMGFLKLVQSPEFQAKLKAYWVAKAPIAHEQEIIGKQNFYQRFKNGLSKAKTRITNLYNRLLPKAKMVAKESNNICLPIQMGHMIFTKGLIPMERGEYELIVKQQTSAFITISIPIVAMFLATILNKLVPPEKVSKLTKYSLWILIASSGIVSSYLASTQLYQGNLEELEQRGLVSIPFYQYKMAKTVLASILGYLVLKSLPDQARNHFVTQQALKITQALIFTLKLMGKI